MVVQCAQVEQRRVRFQQTLSLPEELGVGDRVAPRDRLTSQNDSLRVLLVVDDDRGAPARRRGGDDRGEGHGHRGSWDVKSDWDVKSGWDPRRCLPAASPHSSEPRGDAIAVWRGGTWGGRAPPAFPRARAPVTRAWRP